MTLMNILIVSAGQVVLAARARALSEAARLMCLQNEPVRAVELAEESMALWRQLDESHGLATALLYRGWAAHTHFSHILRLFPNLAHFQSSHNPSFYGLL